MQQFFFPRASAEKKKRSKKTSEEIRKRSSKTTKRKGIEREKSSNERADRESASAEQAQGRADAKEDFRAGAQSECNKRRASERQRERKFSSERAENTRARPGARLSKRDTKIESTRIRTSARRQSECGGENSRTSAQSTCNKSSRASARHRECERQALRERATRAKNTYARPSTRT